MGEGGFKMAQDQHVMQVDLQETMPPARYSEWHGHKMPDVKRGTVLWASPAPSRAGSAEACTPWGAESGIGQTKTLQ